MKIAGKILVELLVLTLVGIGCFLFYQRCSKVTNDYKVLKRVVKLEKTDSTSHYRDLYNREHAQRLQVEANFTTANILYGQKLDSVAKALHTSKKYIQSLITAGVTTEQAVFIDTVYIDSTRQHLSFDYNDQYLDLSGKIDLNHQSSIINYKVNDSIIIATHTKRKNIFSPKETFIDAYSLNPHSRVNSISSLRITSTKQLRWSIGPCAGYGWNGVIWTPSLGISLQYALIRF